MFGNQGYRTLFEPTYFFERLAIVHLGHSMARKCSKRMSASLSRALAESHRKISLTSKVYYFMVGHFGSSLGSIIGWIILGTWATYEKDENPDFFLNHFCPYCNSLLKVQSTTKQQISIRACCNRRFLIIFPILAWFGSFGLFVYFMAKDDGREPYSHKFPNLLP